MIKQRKLNRSTTRHHNSIAEKKRKWVKLAIQLNGYSYDSAGRLVQQTMPNGDTVGYQLDQNGNRTQLVWPDSYYAQYNYDQLNRLTAILPEGSTTVTFDYDYLSRRTLMTYANGNTATYGYALNNDLTSLQLEFNESEVTFDYYYNNVHQIVGINADDGTFLWEPSASSTVDYVITPDTSNAELNQYSSVGGTDYSYDQNGCQTGGPQSATFDSLSRITQIVSGSITNNYWVDPLDRQARKSVNGTDTNYLYNGQQLIATYDDSGDLLQRFIPGLGLDEHFINIQGGTSTYLHTDRQGSIIAETNSSGVIANKFAYSPFGETSTISASNFGYTGQRYDSEIGLYNYKARYYAPAIGRFLQPDPIGYGGGDLNLYAYVGNDGLNDSDPLGLFTLVQILNPTFIMWAAGMANKNSGGGGDSGDGSSAGPLTTVPPGPNLLNPLEWLFPTQAAYAAPSRTPKQIPGEYVKIGKINVPSGNPSFGLPSNFSAYNKHVNDYIRWIETWNSKSSFGWGNMNNKQKDYFANALRHSLGIGYLVYQGMPGTAAAQLALGHETGDKSLDSRQDRNNNIWGARQAEAMSSGGASWQEFVAAATLASAAAKDSGFLK